MRWATFRSNDDSDGVDRVGLVDGEEVRALPAGVALVDLLGDDGSRLAETAEELRRSPAGVYPLADVTWRPPIPQPRSVRDFSAFEEHIRAGLKAQGFDVPDSWYDAPVFWFCNANSIKATGEEIVFPGASREMDYELEIAMVIGQAGIDLDPSEAESHIAGFCLFNDWSARDLQREEMHRAPIGPAKGKDFGTTLGPVLVTPDELADRKTERGYDLTMTASVNGNPYSKGNWADIYWSCGEMLAFASRGAWLYPGDVLAVGTCGTGCLLELTQTYGDDRYPWLEDGDEVVLEVERLGALRSVLRRGELSKPLR